MTFEYLSKFFNTTTAALNNKTTCSTYTNICNSNNDGSSNKTSSCFASVSLKNLKSTSNTLAIASPTTTTATLSNSSRLSPTTLRRKIRKTSRRKRKRRHNGYLHNITADMVDNVGTATTKTKIGATAPTTTTCKSHKCKNSVNKTRTTNLNSYIKNFKKKNCNNPRRHFYCKEQDKIATSTCIKRTKSKTSSCSCSCCSTSCNCSWSRKKLILTIKNIVSLLLSPELLLTTRKKYSHARMLTTTTSTKIKSFVNNEKRKKVQIKQEKLLKNTYVYAPKTKIKQQEKSQCVATKVCKNSTLLTNAEKTSTEILTKQISSSLSSSFLTATNCKSNNIICSTSPKCKTLTTSYKFTDPYSCSKFSSSRLSLSFSAGYSLTSLAPSRIFNELYGVIFMTLLVLSICHNNVLETSAASIKLSQRDVVADSVATERIIMSKNVAASSLNEIPNKRQHPPERIPKPYYQQLPQTNNNLHQPQSYLNQETLQELLENKIEEEKHNHNFQSQNQPETFSNYEQQQPEEQNQQSNVADHDVAIETTYNHTFQSLSIIDGDLTVAVDTSKNLMTIEEEMLVAAAGGAIGVGSNAAGLGNHLHNSINGFESYDATARGLNGIDLMTHYSEANSMPIFDFGMPRNITTRTGHTEAVIKCRVDRLDDKSVSWIRKRDLHILTVGTATYTSDKRFQVTESKDSREWTLHVKSPQARDSGIYECQVNTEPKMSMAFQLNVIEISPDAKAVIIGPADLHFKVGSAIILTCIVHQPSVKDIGPIYWYRGEYMITPFDINENTNQESEFLLASVTPSQTTQNKINILEQHHHHHDGLFGDTAVGTSVGTDTEQTQQILANEITQDFSQRIAMESQLGDTMKSRLRISNAQASDTGNYTCQPTTASSASVMVHVINDENPAAMQKSGAYSFQFKRKVDLMPLVCATTTVIIAAAAASLFLNIICIAEEEDAEKGETYVDEVLRCDCLSSAIQTTTITRMISLKYMPEGKRDFLRQQ